MEDDIEKMYDEADPERLEERSHDEKGSFLDLYRSLASSDTDTDMNLISKLAMQGIIPESMRYGVLTTLATATYRGVAKSTTGDIIYFNWSHGTDLKAVTADTENKVSEALNYFKKCNKGCDLRKSDDAVEDVDDAEKASGGGGGMQSQIAATPSVTETQFMQQQDVKVHPGSATATTPDLENRGQQWHADTLQASKSISELSGKLREWGMQLQATVPQSNEVTSLEATFLKSINASSDQVNKGINSSRLAQQFITWKGQVIKQRLAPLQSWLSRNK